jgi:hypothetical protein
MGKQCQQLGHGHFKVTRSPPQAPLGGSRGHGCLLHGAFGLLQLLLHLKLLEMDTALELKINLLQEYIFPHFAGCF